MSTKLHGAGLRWIKVANLLRIELQGSRELHANRQAIANQRRKGYPHQSSSDSTTSSEPANLAFGVDKWIATDGFLMWWIAEGGEELKTDMPAYKDALFETERWQIITFLREGL